MPTQNCRLARPLGPWNDYELFSECAEMLEETVRYGSHLLDQCVSKESHIVHSAIILLFRHALESADAVQILLRDHNAIASRYQTRGVLEVLMYLKYMLKEDTIRRCTAYLYLDTLNEIKIKKRLDKGSQENRSYESKVSQDFMMRESVTDSDGIKEIIKEHEDFLQSDFFKECVAEHKRLKELNKQREKDGKFPLRIAWYYFFDGPDSLPSLCSRVDLAGTYERFYRRYSGTIHPDYLMKDAFIANPPAGFTVRPLRASGNPAEISGIVTQTCIWIFDLMIQEYLRIDKQSFVLWDHDLKAKHWQRVTELAGDFFSR